MSGGFRFATTGGPPGEARLAARKSRMSPERPMVSAIGVCYSFSTYG